MLLNNGKATSALKLAILLYVPRPTPTDPADEWLGRVGRRRFIIPDRFAGGRRSGACRVPAARAGAHPSGSGGGSPRQDSPRRGHNSQLRRSLRPAGSFTLESELSGGTAPPRMLQGPWTLRGRGRERSEAAQPGALARGWRQGPGATAGPRGARL